MSKNERYQSFWDFFPFYLSEHADPTNRVLHFIGTTLALSCVVAGIVISPWILIAVPFCGYGWAWVGHFIIEKNRPATFTYPVWSLMGDFVMFGMAITGRLSGYIESHPVTVPGESR